MTKRISQLPAGTPAVDGLLEGETVGGVSQSWPVTAVAAAAYVTDPATGRLQIAGVEMGDTGWRDVSAGLVNGWTGDLFVRRVGMIATAHGFTTGDGTDAIMYLIPSGFTALSRGGRVMVPANGVTGANFLPGQLVGIRGGAGNTLASENANNAAAHRFEMAYTTTDPWPVTLPGTPA